MLGVSLLAQERFEEAAEALRQALVVNPEFDLSRKQLAGLKQVEVARQMIAETPLPKIDRLVLSPNGPVGVQATSYSVNAFGKNFQNSAGGGLPVPNVNSTLMYIHWTARIFL